MNENANKNLDKIAQDLEELKEVENWYVFIQKANLILEELLDN